MSTPLHTRYASPQNMFKYPSHLCMEQLFGCDFVVSATGVVPCTHFLNPVSVSCEDRLPTAEGIFLSKRDGSILVNECFQTSEKHVFAAGDCCSVVLGDDSMSCGNLDHAGAPAADMQRHHWFQMRLWSQVDFHYYYLVLHGKLSIITIQSYYHIIPSYLATRLGGGRRTRWA